MEGYEKAIHGNIDSLIKLVNALTVAGIELLGRGAVRNEGGRGFETMNTPKRSGADGQIGRELSAGER